MNNLNTELFYESLNISPKIIAKADDLVKYSTVQFLGIHYSVVEKNSTYSLLTYVDSRPTITDGFSTLDEVKLYAATDMHNRIINYV